MALVLLLVLVFSSAVLPGKRLAGQGSSFSVIEPDGSVFSVGRNDFGQLGLGYASPAVDSPQPMMLVSNVSDVSAGDTHTCFVQQQQHHQPANTTHMAVASAIIIKCVGNNDNYLLGDGTRLMRLEPTMPLGLLLAPGEALQVFCGPSVSCALYTSGAARCWGHNAMGALGVGHKRESIRSLPVEGFSQAGLQGISVGGYHTCFLTVQGAVLCAGYNAFGQLGDGTKTGRSSPTAAAIAASTSPKFASVSAGWLHTCAVTTTGAVYCWGRNLSGELGVNSLTSHTKPQPVVGLSSGARSVWASEASSFVVMQDGSVRAFGGNADGVLGNGSSSTSTKYKKAISAMSTLNNNSAVVLEVRGGYLATCVLLTSESVWCVGSNALGQLGRPRSTLSRSLVLLPSIT